MTNVIVKNVTNVPVSPTIHKDPTCGGHSGPYFLFTGSVSLTPVGKGWHLSIVGIASDKSGNSAAIELSGALSARGRWITTHPWGCLGFLPVQLGQCYPPQLGWHEVHKASDADYVTYFELPSQKDIDQCEITGTIGTLSY